MGNVMSDETAAQITGFDHFSPTVSDVEASAAWYQSVFGMIRLPDVYKHHDREETGYAIILFEPNSGVVIGLHHHTGGSSGPFDESRIGLDHIGFTVPDRASLDAWAVKLDGLGVAHSGVRDITEPSTFSTLVFRDPDNIQLELAFTVPAPGAA